MTIQTFNRCGVVLVLAVLVSGCSFMGGGSGRSSECSWYRSSCMYEGSYESDEEGYAEDEAKRLNREAAERLRRSR